MLSTDEVITQKVGDRIYPIIANEGSQYPFIVYERTSTEAEVSKDGVSSRNKISYTIRCVGMEYGQVVELCGRVDKTIKRGKYGDIRVVSASRIGIGEEYNDGVFVGYVEYAMIVE